MFKSIRKLTRLLVISFIILSISLSMTSSYVRAINAEAVVNSAIPYSLDAMDNILFAEDHSVFANPERGWYKSFFTDYIPELSKLKAQGISVVQIKVDLKNYLDKPISNYKLNEIRSAFMAARNRGLQVIFRAAYDYTGLSSCEPKSLDIITGHIKQLKDIFYEYEDVLYCVQAGFLGPWGEWHSSYYGDTPSLEARKTVLFALMDAVPESRSIQVRRPMFIRDIFENEPGGNVITETTAFNGSYLSRTGYHDDSLLSTDNEYGTYVDPMFNRQDELDWTDNQNKYVPFGGECCFLGTNSDPNNAISELNKLHAQVIHIDYLASVIEKWKSTTYNTINTFDYITEKLGYRFVILNAQINPEVNNGGVLHINLNIRNDGFGNLTNARDFEVILTNGNDSYTVKVNDDPRKWYAENGIMNKDLYFSIPSEIKTGTWSVYLNLPNSSAKLNRNAAFSVRFANTGVWDARKGYNLISNNIHIINSPGANIVSSFSQITRADAELLLG